MIRFEDHPGAARPLCSQDATGDSNGRAAQASEGYGRMVYRATTATRTVVLSRSCEAAVRWSDSPSNRWRTHHSAIGQCLGLLPRPLWKVGLGEFAVVLGTAGTAGIADLSDDDHMDGVG
jgi:hypothetical protein